MPSPTITITTDSKSEKKILFHVPHPFVVPLGGEAVTPLIWQFRVKSLSLAVLPPSGITALSAHVSGIKVLYGKE